MLREFEEILQKVASYYSERVRVHGPTPLGVDWNSAASQQLRFEKLLTVCEEDNDFSMVEYGCGYGQLVASLMATGRRFQYLGLDISKDMISQAEKLFGKLEQCKFHLGDTSPDVCDYAVASGLFNVKQEVGPQTWWDYMRHVLNDMNVHSRKGLAFNCLTTYSDPDRMRSDLYYSNPCAVFDFCKRNVSRNVSLLHDYDLFEFTVVVKKKTHNISGA
jgi:SAM-dependent methyltransferase